MPPMRDQVCVRDVIDLFRMRRLVEQIYGQEAAPEIMSRLDSLLRAHQAGLSNHGARALSEQDAMLITYPDQLHRDGTTPLAALDEFAGKHLDGLINCIHLLPFFPSSSDDGFSVMDYRAVDPKLGGWGDVERLAANRRLMFDAVLNHASVQGMWFKAFLRDESPYRDYFVTVKGNPDLSKVTRPRTTSLLTPFSTARGRRAVWTTFSADQADLDYANPDVLLEMLDLILFYVARGADFIRLDAVAYVWKTIGTECIHRPQAHMIVGLIRSMLDAIAPHVILLTETNVPHAQNIRYLGNGTSEAHLVYNFSLPPLLLHAFLTSTAESLTRWAADLHLPEGNVGFINVLATHDGIGLNGARGPLRESQVVDLVRRIELAGGRVSRAMRPDGSEVPYEINANYMDALDAIDDDSDPRHALSRFLTAHAILLAFKGLPGIYFHSLIGSRGWEEGLTRTGRARSVNREKLDLDLVEVELSDPASLRFKTYAGMKHLLLARRGCPGFAPNARQEILDAGPGLFVILRTPAFARDQILCIHNVTSRSQAFPCRAWDAPVQAGSGVQDVLGAGRMEWEGHGTLRLEPYQSLWLRICERQERAVS